jgi:MFS family permease
VPEPVSAPPQRNAPSDEPGLFSRGYLWVTIGTVALCFLAAFESLAVTTVMPVVSADLNGTSLYALAFAGPLATGVIGMVVAGNWSDRRGPVAPLYASVILFSLGLLIAGSATTMWMLVIGRLVQGFGTGAITVALYVVVARVYPTRLHPSIFAGFAAAWVVPSLVGPFAAGIVAEVWSWHWVFLGVLGFVLVALFMIVPALSGLERDKKVDDAEPWAVRRILWAALAAGAVLALNLLSEIETVGSALAVIAAIVALVAVRPLLPRGTLLARRGLPSVILLRGLAAAAFFGAEVYLPYLLIEDYRFSPALAGLALTLGALTWSAASWIQGRVKALSNRASTSTGSALVIIAIAIAFLTALFHLDPSLAIIGWAIGGGGMGLMYPRISTMTLGMSTLRNQGFNSSAMAISDSLGGALSLAITGIVFLALAPVGGSFPGVFAFAGLVAIGAILVAPRVQSPDADGTATTDREGTAAGDRAGGADRPG